MIINPYDTIITCAHNIILNLNNKEFLTKEEKLLYDQSCRLLNQYFRFTELNVEAMISKMENMQNENTG
jgi:hypothetical protein